jgi:hypothetical protein
MSSGRRRRRRLSGTSRRRTTRPSAQHAVRHPKRPIRVCIQGSRMTEPTPTPENARLIASPRRRTNQFGRKSDWPV